MRDIWQFPQGGIDSGESPKDALFRELKEEIGTDNIEIISEFPHWLSYDFPPNAKPRCQFDGQKQKYFLVRLKSVQNLDINTKNPEFNDYKFVKIDEIFDYVKHFKTPIYSCVINYFKKEGYF